MTRPFFAKDRINRFEIFDKRTTKVIDKMKRWFNEGYPANFGVGHVRDSSANGLTERTGT